MLPHTLDPLALMEAQVRLLEELDKTHKELLDLLQREKLRVSVINFNMSFEALVGMWIKVALAAILAAIFLGAVALITGVFITFLLASLGHRF